MVAIRAFLQLAATSMATSRTASQCQASIARCDALMLRNQVEQVAAATSMLQWTQYTRSRLSTAPRELTQVVQEGCQMLRHSDEDRVTTKATSTRSWTVKCRNAFQMSRQISSISLLQLLTGRYQICQKAAGHLCFRQTFDPVQPLTLRVLRVLFRWDRTGCLYQDRLHC